MNAEELLDRATRSLVSVNERFGLQGEEEDEAWEILIHAFGDASQAPDIDEDVSPAVRRRFERMVKRRRTGEPLPYIVGWVDFLDFRLSVRPGMFIPRLTSEFLAQQAIRRLRGRRGKPVHVDVATGIGPIALAVARAVPHAEVWGLDISDRALSQARANARQLGLENVTFRRSDMFASLPKKLRGQVDVITIHPPYVPRQVVAELPVEIRKFEPRHTLTDGSIDGMDLIRQVVNGGQTWLRQGGWLLIEVTPSEFRSIQPLLRQAGYTAIRSTRGSLPQTRVIVGRA